MMGHAEGVHSPLIDICVPTWNCDPAHFREAIESALAQTEKRWRMIIHDDASTTDMESLVKPYLSDPRVSWHPNRIKLGIGGNWNAAMKLGSAPYVQFLFPDDAWEPHFLARALEAMEKNPAVGIVSLGHEYAFDDSSDVMPLYREVAQFRDEHAGTGRHDGAETLRLWLKHELHPNLIGEPDFTMLRRSVIEKVGPYLEDMRQFLDMEYALRCLRVSDWFYVKENCGRFRVHEGGTSAINRREGKGLFDRLRCFEILIRDLPAGPDRDLAIAARNAALENMAKKFLKRVKGGGTVSAQGGGSFKRFVIRHPFLSLKALWRAKKSM